MTRMSYIQEQLPMTELLTQLAEEASELSQAALKLRRAIDKTNPTPVTVVDACDNVKEEIGDVMLCLRILGFSINVDTYKADMNRKLERWANRLKGSADDDKTESGLLEVE